MTIDPTLGDDDTIHGDGGNDTIFGGTGRDKIWGDSDMDNLVDNAIDGDGADIIFGDHAKIYPHLPIMDSFFINNNFFSIDTSENDGFDTDGVVEYAPGTDFEDTIFGSGNDDIIIGGQDDDILFGGEDDDILIGGHNVLGGHDEMDDMDTASIEAILPDELADLDASDVNDINDIMDGGGDEDLMAGDNAIVIRQNDFTTSFLLNSESLRYQELVDTVIYSMDSQTLDGLYDVNVGFTANISGDPELEPGSIVGYTVILLDHSQGIATAAAQNPTLPRVFGNDVMAGGSENDEMFGQLGDDIMQGDGSVDIVSDTTGWQTPDGTTPFDPSAAVDPSFIIPDNQSTPTHFMVEGKYLLFHSDEAVNDGDDYMEGNAGDDRMYGNLGQDDMIGGNSTLFGLDDATAAFYEIPDGDFARPDGADLIYGGAGDPTRLARNDFVGSSITEPSDDDPFVPLENRHARDADVILGDNANIYRLVDGNGSYLEFAYDQISTYEDRGGLRIIPRAVDLLDYWYTYEPGLVPSSLSFVSLTGAGDLIYGESGDDIIHGQTGDDVLFGNSEDDDLYGEEGQDWISGGTGEDGILGDDGLILTSRNDLIAEPLYGIDALHEDQGPLKNNETVDPLALNAEISTPGNIQRAIINVEGTLKKTVDLLAFDAALANNETLGVNDIIFGGLNDDWIHAGAGDDAVSGAEALPAYYDGGVFGFETVNNLLQIQQQAPVNPGAAPEPNPFWFGFAPYNPGDILRYEGNTAADADDPHGKTKQEFALYDEFFPRRKIMLDTNGEAVALEADAVYDFLLNFNEDEGPLGYHYLGDENAMQTDGDDRIFGDLGNDWIAGGTGRDHMYGGRGDDLLNMDDNHDSGPGGKVGPHDPPTDPLDNTQSDEYQAYADIAYGGAGRDVMILNTGADRAIDWVGEYNSYIVPFSPFGAFHISRTLQPHLPEFLYDLSESDGIDTTVPDGARYVEQKNLDVRVDEPDPLRNGEPYGELGLVLQQDYDWFGQTGAPNDPQPGNFQGQREIMRRELFTDTNPVKLAFGVDVGIWTLADGGYKAAPESLFGETVSIYHLDQIQPSYMEILVTVNISKAPELEGLKKKDAEELGSANAYIIFDYLSATDFKFAGLSQKTNKVQIGHRTPDGWVRDVELPMQLRADKDYDLTLVMYGTVATIWVNEQVSLSHDFGEPLNEGLIGLGTDNASARFDDLQIQKLPPTLTFQFTEDFAGTSTNPFEEHIGNWAITDGHYSGSVVDGDRAITTWALDVAAWSLLEFEALINTGTTGGLIFDYYDVDNFKFAAIDALNDQVVIGHRPSSVSCLLSSVSCILYYLIQNHNPSQEI
jgi:Ca2+-binding RTX toxin-like protein